MGIKIEDLKDTLKLKVSSLEGTVNVYSKPNVFSLKVSPNVDIPKATQNNYGVIKGGNSVLVSNGIPSINPEYLSAFLAANVGGIITGDTDSSIIPFIYDLIHQYFDSIEGIYISKLEDDTALGVITFLKGIAAMGTSLFVNLIASGALKVDGFTQLSNADISEEVSAETAVIRDSLLTDLLRVTTQATILDILLHGQINSETFASGFLGHGLRLNKINDRWTLELDDIIVRKTMTIYELVVQKIRYQGGQVLHSPAGGKVTDVIEESDGWRCEHDSTDSFITGALVLCLTFKVGSEKLNPDGSTTFQGAKVKRYWRLVTDYGKGWFKLSKTDMEAGSDIPEINDDVAVLGHRTDPTQLSAILIVSAGQNSPYIAHYANINSYILEGKEVVREGNLEGIVDKDFGQLEGYGLYSNNVYLKGQLRISTGLTIEEALADSGVSGVSITKVDVEFAVGTDKNKAPTTGWETLAPTSLTDTQYLWTRTVTYLSKGEPNISLPANITPQIGQGVESIVEEFAISTSKTTQPTTGWEITPPTWSSGNYIWSRIKITYKNPTDIKYTGYAVSAVWEAVNELETKVDIAFDVLDDSITAIATRTTTLEDTTGSLTTRMSSAEQKITPESIVSTVTSSTKYTSGLGSKTYFAKPTEYRRGDRWILTEDTQLLDNFYLKGQTLEAVYDSGKDSDWRLMLIEGDEEATEGINLIRNYTFKEGAKHWGASEGSIVELEDGLPTEFYIRSINVIGDEYGYEYAIASENDELIIFDE